MSKTQKSKFLNVVKYDKVFNGFLYGEPEIHYENESKIKIYKKTVDFKEEFGEGVIIGQTVKKEGKFRDFDYPNRNDNWLEVENIITFWKVSSKFNEIILVPKSNAIIQNK